MRLDSFNSNYIKNTLLTLIYLTYFRGFSINNGYRIIINSRHTQPHIAHRRLVPLLLHQLQMAQHGQAIGRLLVDHAPGDVRNVALRDEQSLRKIAGLLLVVYPHRQLLRIAHALALLEQQHVLLAEAAHHHRVEELLQVGQRFAAAHVLRDPPEVVGIYLCLKVNELQCGWFYSACEWRGFVVRDQETGDR